MNDAETAIELFPADRLQRAQKLTAKAGLDALLITPGADLRHLTGYAALALERLTCLVLPAYGEPVLVVPRLEKPAALASPVSRLGLDVLDWNETDDPYALVATLLPPQTQTVGLANRMWVEQAQRLRTALPSTDQVLAGEVLRALRMVKDPAEVDALRRAGQAIDGVHARMSEWLRVGRTEREIGRDIADAILTEGHETVNFVIVGSGPNGASPHHALSDRVVERGDPVVVDIGGTTAEGYCSDSTRTYVLGTVPAGFAESYAVLLEAQTLACDAVRPGLTAQALDAMARDHIASAGYGELFIHRTGHGIGLEEHEEPWIVAGNAEPLEPGMCFSIEPGIYTPGRHGARLEDIVVCTEDGGERLNQLPRDLVVLEG